MAITPSFPGIYIEELPSSAHTITAAPTSITVFVGYTHPFKTNPANFGQAIEIFSFADYEREFGGAYESGLIDSNVADAVNMFFLNGGADAFVVALQPQHYTNSEGNRDSKPVTPTNVAVAAATVLFGVAPEAIQFAAREPVDSVTMTVTISNPQKTTISGDTADIVISYGTQTETYRKVNLISKDPNFIETRIGTTTNPVSSLITVSSKTAYPAAFPFRPSWSASTPQALGVSIMDSDGNVQQCTTAGTTGATAPAWATTPNATTHEGTVIWTLVAAWQPSTAETAGNLILDSNGNIQRCTTAGTTGATAPAWATTINGTTNDGTVVWTLLALQPTVAQATMPSPVAAWQPSTAETAGNLILDSNGNIQRCTMAGTTGATAPAWATTINGTTNDGTVVWTRGAVGVFDPSNFVSVFQADSNLDKVPIFNLVVIPGIINNAVLSEALAFCERRFAFLIMDPPVIDNADGSSSNYIGNFIDQAKGDASGNIAPLSQNGALYFPYLQSFDPLTGSPLNLPPSGFTAGIFARTDTNRGVWKAPAGLETTILDTTGVVSTGLMTDPRQGDLNNKGVNCLRSFPTGTVVFGARTLVSSNPAYQQWKYVPVRRMALFIEQTLRANLTWVIFEPNDTPLWTAIRTSIEGFMLSLLNQGALQGSTPSQAFQVKCDSSTTTQDDINNGIVNIIVAFAPLKPAEFVIIKIAQLAGQAQS